MITVRDILNHMAESRVTERNCEVCNKVFNPQDKDSYILVCSFECAHIEFTGVEYKKESHDKRQ